MSLNDLPQGGTTRAPGTRNAAGRRSLALFDLDYTLLPVDSDYEWARFLIREGVVDGAEYERENDRFFEQYKAGVLDIGEFLQFQLAPLAAYDDATLAAWHRRFMAETISPNIRPAATELVNQHRNRGDLCVVVSATNEFVTAPIARAFGIDHLIATSLQREGQRYTGRPEGVPSFREGKVTRMDQWLASQGLAWDSFDETWFYSDSLNDLPLLERVSRPVATNPDERLAAIARERGWPVRMLFDDDNR